MPGKPAATTVKWRGQLPVLVVEAQTLGAIGVIRSLGRAGYPVHACAPRADALGLLSNYAHTKAICPNYGQETFLPWLRQYIQRYDIRAIIPSEGLLLALRPVFSEFAHLFPFSNDAKILYPGMSKFDLFKAFLENRAGPTLANHLPPTLLVADLMHLPRVVDLEALGMPLYIKADGCYSMGRGDGVVIKSSSALEARASLLELAPRFHKVLIQGHVSGQGVGVFLLLWNGQVLAEFMHRRLHEVPHTGGVSSLRESWWHSTIRADALARLQYLGWQGIAMMEYRWEEANDRFYLMEMNGRFWGSLHLALYAGVDFPVLLLDAFHGCLPTPVQKFPRGLRCRHTFPKEVEYIWSRAKDRQLPVSSRLWSILEFFQLSLDSRIYSDLFFPGDRKLYWINLKHSWKTFLD